MAGEHNGGQGMARQYDNGVTKSRDDWLRFVLDKRFSRSAKWKLIDQFGSPSSIYDDNDNFIQQISNKARQVLEPSFAQLHNELSWLSRPGNYFITYEDEAFPENLRNIADPPLALFATGNISLLDAPAISIVGSRKPTSVGGEITKRIAKDLASCGLSIISGLAFGVDSLAHEAVVNNAGKCVAVLGSGLDITYPARNKWLFKKVESTNGLLISEYPSGTRPTRYTFPERNRLVSGLGDGVVVIEAAVGSGTMITADFAGEQNKPLMVVPGSAISAQYAGSHTLIKEGADLVTSAEDIAKIVGRNWKLELESMPLSKVKSAATSHSTLQNKVLSIVSEAPRSTDWLLENTSLTINELSAMLLDMELRGLIVRDTHGNFIATM